MSEKAKVTAKKPEAKRENSVSKARKTELSHPLSSPIDHILFLQRAIGNQAVQKLFKAGVIQAKLKIGQPNDIYEQEADRVAEQVMRMPEPQVWQQPEEKEEEEIIQPKKVSRQTPEVTPDLKSRIQSLKGGGQPLSESTRAFFEPRLGYNLSQIRVHVHTRAAGMARIINARAFTIGKHIVFGAGQYSPFTTTGKRLLAHEIVHAMQQRTFGNRQRKSSKLASVKPRDHGESEADAASGWLNAGEISIEPIKYIYRDGGLYYNPADPTSLSPELHYKLHGKLPAGFVVHKGRVVKGPVYQYEAAGDVFGLTGYPGCYMTIAQFSYLFIPSEGIVDISVKLCFDAPTEEAASSLNDRNIKINAVISNVAQAFADIVLIMIRVPPLYAVPAGVFIGTRLDIQIAKRTHIWHANDTLIYEQSRKTNNEVTEKVRYEGTREYEGRAVRGVLLEKMIRWKYSGE